MNITSIKSWWRSSLFCKFDLASDDIQQIPARFHVFAYDKVAASMYRTRIAKRCKVLHVNCKAAKQGLRLHVFPNDKVATLSDLETQSYLRSNKPDRQGFHPFWAFLQQLISSSQWNVSGFIKSTAYICTSEVFGICCTSAIAFLMSASSVL